MKAVGQVVGGIGALRAGNFTAAVDKTNATNAVNDGTAEAAQIRDTARAAIGRQYAGLAGSGFAPDSGSALEAVRQSSIEAELDVMRTRRKAQAEAVGYRTQGGLAKMQGKYAMIGGVINGAASLMDDAAKYGTGGAG